jgi:hypothetical protein
MTPQQQRELQRRLDSMTVSERRMFDALKQGCRDYVAEKRGSRNVTVETTESKK